MTNKFIEQRVEVLENELSELKLIVEQIRKHYTAVHEPLGAATSSVEDIIEFEGARYKKVDREAREGDVVVLEKHRIYWQNDTILGKPYEVIDNHYIDEYGAPLMITSDFKVYEKIPFSSVDRKSTIEKSPNQLRGEIIEKAKEFVEDLTKHISQWNYKNETEYGVIDSKVGRWLLNTEFVVNNEKLTIVALLRGSGSGSVYSRGIAKCMPGDVYNEHIGKAIALGRALGLDVSEFEGAVQPNETVEGMFIDTGSHVLETTDKRYVFGKTCHINSNYGQKCKIINDTNTIYGGVE